MVKKNRYQYEEAVDGELEPISRSQKKRDSSALQRLGEELVLLSPAKWDILGVDGELREALSKHKTIKTKEAKRRHLQLIGRLMREQCEEAALQGKQNILAVYNEKQKYL